MKKILLFVGLMFVCFSLSFAKDKVAVFPFATVSNDYNIGVLAETEMSSLLLETKKFDVIERSQISEIMSEQKFSNSGVIDESGASEIGKISGVKFLVLGTVSNVRYIKTRKVSDNGKSYYDVDASITLQLKIVEVESASVVFSKTYNMKNGTNLGLFNLSLNDDGTPEGTLSGMLKKTYKKDVSKDLLNAFPITGEILSVEDKKTVIIDVGSEQGVKKGMVFNIVVKEEKVNSSGKKRVMVKKVGKIKVTDVSGEDSSTCKVSEINVPLEEGLKVSYAQK